MDTGLIVAFQAIPSRDLGHKLETVMLLENRRRRKELLVEAR